MRVAKIVGVNHTEVALQQGLRGGVRSCEQLSDSCRIRAGVGR